MEKNMETTILVYVKGLGLYRDCCKVGSLHSWLTEGQLRVKGWRLEIHIEFRLRVQGLELRT